MSERSFTMETEVQAHKEGPVARAIEHQTARLPSDIFLWSAIGAGGVALFFQLSGYRRWAGPVAQLAPVLLLMGIYNKIVKVAGSDRLEQSSDSPVFH
jgi:hypothetical protein